MFTLSEIIDLAVRIETNGQKAYRKAQGQVTDPALASMLGWLADEEAEHEKWFPSLKENVKTNLGRSQVGGDEPIDPAGRSGRPGLFHRRG